MFVYMSPNLRPSFIENWTWHLECKQWSWSMMCAQKRTSHWRVCTIVSSGEPKLGHSTCHVQKPNLGYWMYLRWSLCTLYLHTCQVKVTVGDSGLCCACVTSFEHSLTFLRLGYRKLELQASTRASQPQTPVLYMTWLTENSFIQFSPDGIGLCCKQLPQRIGTRLGDVTAGIL